MPPCMFLVRNPFLYFRYLTSRMGPLGSHTIISLLNDERQSALCNRNVFVTLRTVTFIASPTEHRCYWVNILIFSNIRDGSCRYCHTVGGGKDAC